MLEKSDETGAVPAMRKRQEGDRSEKPAAGSLLDPGHRPKEIGGREGPDPTRYGDWEKAGRCIDF